MKVFIVVVIDWTGGDYEESHAQSSIGGVFTTREAAVKWTKKDGQCWNSWREFSIKEEEIQS